VPAGEGAWFQHCLDASASAASEEETPALALAPADESVWSQRCFGANASVANKEGNLAPAPAPAVDEPKGAVQSTAWRGRGDLDSFLVL
jgi:hypothetical protein